MLNIEGMTEEQRRQVEAALILAIKGKLIMTAPCPRCERAKVLHEKILSDGSIRHECRSCGYLVVWSPRATLNAETRRSWLAEANGQIPGGIYRN